MLNKKLYNYIANKHKKNTKTNLSVLKQKVGNKNENRKKLNVAILAIYDFKKLKKK